mgnify:CR=1 FL=1
MCLCCMVLFATKIGNLIDIICILQVPEGLEMCVKLMLPGEVAMVTSTSQYAYDKFPRCVV